MTVMSDVLANAAKNKKTRQEALDEAYSTNTPNLEQSLAYAKELMSYASGLNQESLASQIQAMLKYNPKLMAQDVALQKKYYPYEQGLGEKLAKDVSGRLGASEYQVPDSLVALYRKQRLASDIARGLPVSGVSSASEAEAITKMGYEQRNQDVNTALSLMGRTPTASTQSINYTGTNDSSGTLASIFGNLASNEYSRSSQKLGYLLQKKQSSGGGSALGAIGSVLGSVAGSAFGPIGTAVGTAAGSFFNK